MGCITHDIGNGNLLRFSEGDDDVVCLCTFPHNDGKELTPARVRSLAYLGAMLMLSQRGELGRAQYVYVPADLPRWMRESIDRCVPDTYNDGGEHEKGWIAGAVWGVAEVLRSHGEEVIARDMLNAIGGLEKVRKHAEPCDIEEIEKHPWVHESNIQGEAQPPAK